MRLLTSILMTVSRLLICGGVAGLLVLYLVRIVYEQRPTLERIKRQQMEEVEKLQRLMPED